MLQVHRVVAFAVVGIFAIGWVWGIGAFLARRGPGEWFWRWLAVAQVLAIAEALLGVGLLVLGQRPTTWLHYVYGAGPLAVLVVAHGVARDPSFRQRPWVPFAFAAFVCFGLTLRALMTGLGLG